MTDPNMTNETMMVRAGMFADGLGPLVKDVSIAIDLSGRIARVGTRLAPAPGCEIYEFPGSTVLPGLIDCHVHLVLDGRADWLDISRHSVAELTLRAVKSAQRTLAGGVTTARCLGAPHGVEIAVRDAIDEGAITGPRLICAGRVICPTGGHGQWMGRVADGPMAVRAAVRAELAEGADVIKVTASGGVLTPGSQLGGAAFTNEELGACVEEAHRAKVPVVAHALTRDAVRAAVEAGCDGIEHGDGLDAESAELMARKGVHLGATLTSASDFLEALRTSRLAVLPSAIQKLQQTWPRRVAAFQLALAHNVPLVMSTDAGTPFHEHGGNAAVIPAMVEQGLNPLRALSVATIGGAQALGLDGEVGSLEVGKRADLLVVDGNPIQEPALFRDPSRISLVMRAGRVYAGSAFGHVVARCGEAQ